jgi:hypothetical protein
MGSVAVVKRHVPGNGFSRLRDALVGFQIDLLVFDALPEPLNENVVSPTAFAVHAESDVVGFECLGKFEAGKLASLIAVHDLWCPVFGEGLLKCCDAKVGMHGVGEPSGQDPADGPVHDCHKVQNPRFIGR